MEKNMRRVVVESPLKADSPEQKELHKAYARACCRECIMVYREAPFASHLLYDQPGLLRDEEPYERELGIAAGLAYVGDADATVVYIDLGISAGMRRGIEAAEAAGRPVERRRLRNGWRPA